ncbi:MAG TPA: TIGR03087 family PEP-CTERM/XrtA system glycosyltransferase [Candidatus Dormibacteraeota bacterium]|nr:TIGR03087 family PEP-CTERM/XrtA system glycosyltransferase [Candidatus Dormibacteraeota bacterium]
MNILYLCHRIPYPPDKGDKIRSFHQIEYLSRNHKVHLGCLVDAEEDRHHIPALQPYCASVDAVWRGKGAANLRTFLALLGRRSLSVAAFHSADLARRIDQRVKSGSIDLAIVFSSAMAQYLPRDTDLPTIVDYVDVDSEKWRVYSEMRSWPLSWLYRLEAGRLRRYEETLAVRHDESVFVAEKEAEIFRRSAASVRTHVIPNGVDLAYFRRPECAAPAERSRDIVFVGMMDYFPNIDAVTYFTERMFPRILEAVPEATFRIVGRNPSRSVRDLARHRNVSVTGAVPDVRPFLTDAAISVAPFRVARGVQNKILEAMAMEVPVVGTPTGFQGITAREGDGVRIEEQPEPFAAAVVAHLTDPGRRRDAGRRARAFVERHHRWEDHGAILEALIDEVLERRSRRVCTAGIRS